MLGHMDPAINPDPDPVSPPPPPAELEDADESAPELVDPPVDPALDAIDAELGAAPEIPPDGELAADSGSELVPDEPPVIKPPFEPPPNGSADDLARVPARAFNPYDVDQTVRHGGSPGVRVRHMGLTQTPVKASSIPELGGRVVPTEILAEAKAMLERQMDPSELRPALKELLAPWLP